MEIAARLRQLGFPSNYVGFPYLACAISLVQTEPEYLYQVFKCLYPAVATAFSNLGSLCGAGHTHPDLRILALRRPAISAGHLSASAYRPSHGQ